jgi:hypothetical protein
MNVNSTHDQTQGATWATTINGHREPQEDESNSEYGGFNIAEESDK